MASIQPPAAMSRIEKATFRQLCDSLESQGVDPASRSHLIEDFSYSDARLTALRLEYKNAKGKSRMAVARALNVASAERRRLHAQIFAAVKEMPGENLAPSEASDQDQIAAEDAWRKYFDRRTGKTATMEEILHDPESKRLEAQFGEPPWSVLVSGPPFDSTPPIPTSARKKPRRPCS